jgi:predicted aminopeptidase
VREAGADVAGLRAAKQGAFDELGARLDALSTAWNDGVDYRKWLARDLNNARLAAIATYYDCVPGFERILAESGGDLERFYERVEKLGRRPYDERRAALCSG